jgi:hypothetical protein
MPVAHACNPSYSGSRDQEDCGLKPAQANTYLKKPFTKIGLVEWLKVKALSSSPSTTIFIYYIYIIISNKILLSSQAQWLMPIILAIMEARLEGLQFQTNPSKKFMRLPSQQKKLDMGTCLSSQL